MQIEDAVSKVALPTNTIAVLRRGIELLQQAGTDHPNGLQPEERIRYRKVLWILCNQVHATGIDLIEEWNILVGGGD